MAGLGAVVFGKAAGLEHLLQLLDRREVCERRGGRRHLPPIRIAEGAFVPPPRITNFDRDEANER
jgi:hypothetical protein